MSFFREWSVYSGPEICFASGCRRATRGACQTNCIGGQKANRKAALVWQKQFPPPDCPNKKPRLDKRGFWLQQLKLFFHFDAAECPVQYGQQPENDVQGKYDEDDVLRESD